MADKLATIENIIFERLHCTVNALAKFRSAIALAQAPQKVSQTATRTHNILSETANQTKKSLKSAVRSTRINILAKCAPPPRGVGKNKAKSKKQGRNKAFLLFRTKNREEIRKWVGENIKIDGQNIYP